MRFKLLQIQIKLVEGIFKRFVLRLERKVARLKIVFHIRYNYNKVSKITPMYKIVLHRFYLSF